MQSDYPPPFCFCRLITINPLSYKYLFRFVTLVWFCNPLGLTTAMFMGIGLEPDGVSTQLKVTTPPLHESVKNKQFSTEVMGRWAPVPSRLNLLTLQGSSLFLHELEFYGCMLQKMQRFNKNVSYSWVFKHLLISFLTHQTKLKPIQCFSLTKSNGFSSFLSLLSVFLLKVKQTKACASIIALNSNKSQLNNIWFGGFNNLCLQSTCFSWYLLGKLSAKCISPLTEAIYLQYRTSGNKPSKIDDSCLYQWHIAIYRHSRPVCVGCVQQYLLYISKVVTNFPLHEGLQIQLL